MSEHIKTGKKYTYDDLHWVQELTKKKAVKDYIFWLKEQLEKNECSIDEVEGYCKALHWFLSLLEDIPSHHLVYSDDSEWLIVHATCITVDELVNVGRLLGVVSEDKQ